MKTAIVTGGTKGIGRGVCEMLLRKGYYVIATYANDNAAAQEFLSENTDAEKFLEVKKVDQSDRKQTYAFIDYVKKIFSHVDCIVCNAGLSIRSPFTEGRDEDWDKMFEVAVHSHYILLRELYTLIPCNSRIIFTGSQMGINPHATVLAYGVTKSAVHAMAKNLVKEMEPKAITVNVVVPGFVETEWQKNKPEQIRQNICKKTAVHRFASIDEIIKGYEFCIDNEFVNGTLIEINGGYNYL